MGLYAPFSFISIKSSLFVTFLDMTKFPTVMIMTVFLRKRGEGCENIGHTISEIRAQKHNMSKKICKILNSLVFFQMERSIQFTFFFSFKSINSWHCRIQCSERCGKWETQQTISNSQFLSRVTFLASPIVSYPLYTLSVFGVRLKI